MEAILDVPLHVQRQVVRTGETPSREKNKKNYVEMFTLKMTNISNISIVVPSKLAKQVLDHLFTLLKILYIYFKRIKKKNNR